MKISMPPHFRASLDLKYSGLPSNIPGQSDVDIIIFLNVLCCCLCLGIAMRWCTRYKRSSTLTDGLDLLVLIRLSLRELLALKLQRLGNAQSYSIMATHQLHGFPKLVRKLCISSVIDSPVPHSNEESWLILSIKGFKVSAQKISMTFILRFSSQ